MEEKFEPYVLPYFNILPEEVAESIRQSLVETPLAHDSFAFSCRYFYRLSKPERLRYRLASFATAGKQAQVQEMLLRYPELLLLRGTIKDLSGRIFENITVWEYLLWALDVKYMAPMILACLPKDANGKKIAIELLDLLENLEKKGISFTLKGRPYVERHYDGEIINVLHHFLNNFNLWDQEEKLKFWCEEVRQAQLRVPAHIAQHYCDPDMAFTPDNLFNYKALARNIFFYNQTTQKYEAWWPEENNEAKPKFAISRGGEKYHCVGRNHMRGIGVSVQRDLDALKNLYDTRCNQDLEILKIQLKAFIASIDIQEEAVASMGAS